MKNKNLHIYAQQAWHDPAFVIGNREALICLRDAINSALKNGLDDQSNNLGQEYFTSDGEGYPVIVLVEENNKKWIDYAVPYTKDFAEEKFNHEGIISPELAYQKKCSK